MANLPTGYTELEYIESTGTQYVKTGIFPKNTSKVVCHIKDYLSSGWACLFGAAIAGNYDSFAFWGDGSNIASYYFGNSFVSVGTKLSTGLDYEIITDRNSVSLNGVSASSQDFSFSSTYELVIFAQNYSGEVSLFSKYKLKRFDVYEESEKLREYIPCRNSSGEVGLYDLVSNRFFGNAGTGTFVAGPEIMLPETPASFFQSTSVVLRWSPVECDGYRLYKNGSILAETTETLYIDDAVSNGQDIDYSITAYRGNLESESKTITVHIREGYTILTPVITSAFFQ